MEKIIKLNIVVNKKYERHFGILFSFVYDLSDKPTRKEIDELWNISFGDEFDKADMPIYEYDALVDFFDDFIRNRISKAGDLFKIYLRSPPDIMEIKMPFRYNWQYFEREIRAFVRNFNKDEYFMEWSDRFPIESASKLVDEVYRRHCIDTRYDYKIDIVLMDCKDLSSTIEKLSRDDDFCNSGVFTPRQYEVMIKRMLSITLSSTERGILSQIRHKINRADELLKVVVDDDYGLFNRI